MPNVDWLVKLPDLRFARSRELRTYLTRGDKKRHTVKTPLLTSISTQKQDFFLQN
jgi:hypothetical protein